MGTTANVRTYYILLCWYMLHCCTSSLYYELNIPVYYIGTSIFYLWLFYDGNDVGTTS